MTNQCGTDSCPFSIVNFFETIDVSTQNIQIGLELEYFNITQWIILHCIGVSLIMTVVGGSP